MDYCSKYKISAGQAYTEDDILIYNIICKNLPKDATKQQITEYFQRFGKVLNVRLVEKNEARKCFIDFEDSKVATRVLKRTNCFMNKTLKIQPCDSYFQPDVLKIIAQLEGYSKSNSVIEQNALILKLNDDCLENICKQLEPRAQINFALTCQRFCDVFKLISSVEYQTLSIDTIIDWKMWQVRIFLQLVGPQVKTLIFNKLYFVEHYVHDIRCNANECIKFFSLFCTDVEHLSVYSYVEPSGLMRLLSGMNKLKELELHWTNDNFIEYLKNFKNLKSFSITKSLEITGKNIHLLTGLEKLSLLNCNNLSSCHFKEICKKLKNLQSLDIRSSGELVTEDFQQIVENLLELKSLKITATGENLNCLAQLPKLTHLELENSNSVSEEFFKILAKHQAEQLEELKLANLRKIPFDISTSVAELKKLKIFHCDGDSIDDEGLIKISQLKELEEICCTNCTGITDKSVLEVLRNCLKVKHLQLIRCFNIRPEFITNCISLLKEQKECWLRSDRVVIQLSDRYKDSLRSKLNTIPKEDYADVLDITWDKAYDVIFDSMNFVEYGDDEVMGVDFSVQYFTGFDHLEWGME